MKAWGDIIYKLLFDNSALGGALKKVLEVICIIVHWVVNDVWKGFFCPIMGKILPPMLNAVVGFLGFIQQVIDGINRLACAFGACLPESASVRGAINNVAEFKTRIENGGLGCDKNATNLCFLNTDDEKPDPALPSATR